jgi:hypothetical protein
MHSSSEAVFLALSGMVRIPRRFAPLVYGIIQAAITSAVATSIATYNISVTGLKAIWYWLGCWGLSWLAMLPVVVFVSPWIQWAVIRLTEPLSAKTKSPVVETNEV